MSENPYQAPSSAVLDPMHSRDAEEGFARQVQICEASAGMNWLTEAWKLFTVNPGLWIVFAIVTLVLMFMVQFLGPFGGIAQSLFTPVLTGGIMLGCDQIRRGGTLEFDHLFAGFRDGRMGQLVLLGAIYLGLSVILIIVALVPVLMVTGLSVFQGNWNQPDVLVALLLALGAFMILLLPLMAASWMAVPLIVLNQVPPVEALTLSFFGCLKNWLPFLVFSVVLLPAMVLATLPLFLGWLVLAPVMMASMYTSYRGIFYVAWADR